jgi:hypothetical protein
VSFVTFAGLRQDAVFALAALEPATTFRTDSISHRLRAGLGGFYGDDSLLMIAILDQETVIAKRTNRRNSFEHADNIN